MRQRNATFANFICRFGDDKLLLDYAKPIVIPAFTRDTYVRRYGERTNYHFYETELMNIAKDDERPIMVLAGRFVKQTILKRTQIFDDTKGLLQDDASLRSAPSAFFVLILNNHRLIYFPETSYAPDLSAFRATAQQFLGWRHKEFIEECYEESRGSDDAPSKKSFYESHPRPSVELIPLTSRADIEMFMRRFKILKKIQFRIVRPNDDINAGELLDQVRKLTEELGSSSAEVTASCGDGLDIEAAIEAVKDATRSGNQDVKVSGVDSSNNKLLGNNEEFRLSAEIKNAPRKKFLLAKRLVDKFMQLNNNGAINAPQADSNQAKVMKLKTLR